jgi:hypothetical protein
LSVEILGPAPVLFSLKNIKMKTKSILMIIMSQLSDVQENQRLMHQEDNNKRINFVKYLLLKYPRTDVLIDEEKEYEEFETKHQ